MNGSGRPEKKSTLKQPIDDKVDLGHQRPILGMLSTTVTTHKQIAQGSDGSTIGELIDRELRESERHPGEVQEIKFKFQHVVE